MSTNKDGVLDTENTEEEALEEEEEESDDDTGKTSNPSEDTNSEDEEDDDSEDDNFVPEGMDAKEFAELPDSAREVIEKQEEDLVNYRKMAKSRKGSRSLPSKGDKEVPDEESAKPKKPEGVSPSEFRTNNQQMAIRVASADPDLSRLDDNWDDVMGHYVSKDSDGTFQDYLNRITNAYSKWEKGNPVKKGSDTKGKRDAANAAADRAKPSPGKKKSVAKKRKRVLQGSKSMDSWYGKKK